MALQAVKGMYDILPDRMRKFEHVDNLFKYFLELYGYELTKTPIVEYTKVFQKDNDTSDMVTKEMFTFTMNHKDSLTLRPEGTAGIIRSFIQNKLYSGELPVKLGYIGEMFRYERPQKGRQRQFTQLGIEALGEKNPLLDAEVIALGYSFVKTLGLKAISVCINTLGDNSSRMAYRQALKAYFEQYRDLLCLDCQNRLDKNPLRILDCKIDHDKEFMANAPKISDYLSAEAKAYFDAVLAGLNLLNIPYVIDESLVRGLDYYTDTVFEVKSTHEASGAQSTIFGGGRYDSLVEEMGGPDMSGIGFAIGEERLILLGEAEGIFEEEKPSLDVYVIDLLASDPYVLKVATALRNNGYKTEVNYKKRSLKAQFKSAERFKARFIAIIGEDERNDMTVTLKDSLDKSQVILRFDELLDYLDEKIGD